MDTPFLTIAEASKLTGRSPSTIRRIVHSIVKAKSHPDRGSVLPSIEEARMLQKEGEIFSWKIREDIIKKEMNAAPKEEKKVSRDGPLDVLEILRDELDLKNKQIEKQWEVIHSLNERLREGNILMGSLQKRLAPPETPSPAPSAMEASIVTPSKKSSTEASKKPSTETKKGFLSWFR